jgi:release factor glutamine methyltransferase
MGFKIQTIQEMRQYLSDELDSHFSDTEKRAIANVIIRSVTGQTGLHALAFPGKEISRQQARQVKSICMKLRTGMPLQYAIGETIFYNCTIKVNRHTLIPRPETEELVDLVIRENRDFTGKILDMGTGSGCIAIALAKNLPGADVSGIDISRGAIKKARENAFLNDVIATFCRGDILKGENFFSINAGIIVSNPPYVTLSEKETMERNVLGFEPHEALFVPDSDPLVFYRGILRMARHSLRPGGKVYFEINERMGSLVSGLLSESSYSGIKIITDINGKERIIKGIKDE